jgi:F-type H+-transporting ATPase subunit gamma
MAENLFLLKRRIRTAKNINQIAKAMEMVSASKIKRAQVIVEKNRDYSERISSLTENLLAKTDVEKFNHPFLTNTDSDKKLLIAFSPDKGLCGSLNTNLYKALLDREMKNTRIVVVGRKLEVFSAKMGYDLLASFPMGTSLPKYSVVTELIKLIEDEFSSGKVGSVEILYAQFGSIFQQTVTTTQLLPLNKPESSEQELPFLVEPSLEEVLSALLPYYIEVKLYDFLMNAYTSEQAARMVAMQNAKNNAKDVAEFLTLTYNKNRQEKITNEILDLANNQ